MKKMMLLMLGIGINGAVWAQTTQPSAEQVIRANADVTANLITQIKRELELEKNTRTDGIQAADYYQNVQPKLKAAFERGFREYQEEFERQIVPGVAAYLKRFQSDYNKVNSSSVLNAQQKEELLNSVLVDKGALEDQLTAIHTRLLRKLFSYESPVIKIDVPNCRYYFEDNCNVLYLDEMTGKVVQEFKNVRIMGFKSHNEETLLPNTDPIVRRFSGKTPYRLSRYLEFLTNQSIYEGCYSKTCLALSAGFRIQFLESVLYKLTLDLSFPLADGKHAINISNWGSVRNQKWLDRWKFVELKRVVLHSSVNYTILKAFADLPLDIGSDALPQAMEDRIRLERQEAEDYQRQVDAEVARKIAEEQARKKKEEQERQERAENKRKMLISSLPAALFSELEMSRCPDSVMKSIQQIKQIRVLSDQEKVAIMSGALSYHVDKKRDRRTYLRSLKKFDRSTCL